MSLRVKACMICDDLRPELNGKATIVGFGGILPIPKIAVSGGKTIPQLTFVFVLEPGASSSEVVMQITGPDGNTMTKSPNAGPINIGPTSAMNLAITTRNVRFANEGDYTIRLTSEGREVFVTALSVAFSDLQKSAAKVQ